jgi:hypothetical protein
LHSIGDTISNYYKTYTQAKEKRTEYRIKTELKRTQRHVEVSEMTLQT